jgi:PadR family transcriptional regulator PadR
MVSAESSPTAQESRLMHGVLEMCVLAVLDVAPLHAYGIVQRLHELGFANAGYGSIYPLVTRLRKQGLVEQTLEPNQSGLRGTCWRSMFAASSTRFSVSPSGTAR